jgi:hypothetical protein
MGDQVDDEFLPEGTRNWIHSCHHRPKPYEIALDAISRLMDGFGVEAAELHEDEEQVDSYHRNFRFSYVNMGDTCTATILRDHATNEYHITSWGDYIERLERQGVKFK